MEQIHAPVETIWVGTCNSCFAVYTADDRELKPLPAETGVVRKYAKCLHCRRDVVFHKEPPSEVERLRVHWFEMPAEDPAPAPAPVLEPAPTAVVNASAEVQEKVAEAHAALPLENQPATPANLAAQALSAENQRIEPANPEQIPGKARKPRAPQ